MSLLYLQTVDKVHSVDVLLLSSQNMRITSLKKIAVEVASKSYTQIHTLWDIAFALVFDYTDSQEDAPVGVIGW